LRSLLIFILLFNSLGLLYSQQYKVNGFVVSNSQKIAFANVFEKNLKVGTITNKEGFFKLENISEPKIELKISCMGFETQIISLDLKENEVNNITIELNPSSSKLSEVVVSGTMKTVSKSDSPVSVEVYSSKFFEANPSSSLHETVSNINGVRPQMNCNVCNTGDIHINGLEGSYTMILIDGMPIVSGLASVYGLSGIPQSLIERIEVVKGPASALYGSEAIGGVINVITKNTNQAPKFSADVFSTHWGDINADLGLSFGKKDKFSTLLGLNYFNYQNPIDNNNDNFTDLTLQNRLSVFNKWSFNRPQNRIFNVAGRLLYEDRWGGEMNWTPEFRGGDSIYGESILTQRWEVFGTYQLPVKEEVYFQFSSNGHYQDSYYGEMFYLARQNVSFGQLYWNKNMGKHALTSALVYRYNFYDDNTTATSIEIENQNTENAPSIIHLPGAFVQDEITMNDQNKLLLGMRYDYNNLHGNIWTPRINYKWNSKNKNSILRIGAGNGFRVVNVFTEDHAALTGARKVIFEETLNPETSYNANVNWVQNIYFKKSSLIVDVASWHTFFNNKIIPDYETDATKIIYKNLDGNAISQGVTINTEMLFQNGFNAIVGVTLMDVSINENGISERQLLTENFTGTFTIGYYIKKIKLKIDYTGNVYSPMRLPILGELDDRPEYSPWFSIQNIQVSTKIKDNWEIYGGIKNLLNYTPPTNSIARAFDPFDREVTFDTEGQPLATPNNPNALTFDPSYVFASNQGIRGFLGVRYKIPHKL
jgi:outer membrane receptor for ferrienterochelin and colicins